MGTLVFISLLQKEKQFQDTIYNITVPKFIRFFVFIFVSEAKHPSQPSSLLSPPYDRISRLPAAQVRGSNNLDRGQCSGTTP